MAMTMTMMTTTKAPNRLAFATGLYVCRSWPTLASVHRGTAGQHGERGVIGASSGRRGNLVTCCRRGQGYRKEHEVDYYVPEWPSLSSAPVPERPWAAPGGTPYPASAARQAPMQSLQGGRSTCVTGTARMCGRRLPQWYKCRHSESPCQTFPYGVTWTTRPTAVGRRARSPWARRPPRGLGGAAGAGSPAGSGA